MIKSGSPVFGGTFICSFPDEPSGGTWAKRPARNPFSHARCSALKGAVSGMCGILTGLILSALCQSFLIIKLHLSPKFLNIDIALGERRWRGVFTEVAGIFQSGAPIFAEL